MVKFGSDFLQGCVAAAVTDAFLPELCDCGARTVEVQLKRVK